jgi:hypothetical protein
VRAHLAVLVGAYLLSRIWLFTAGIRLEAYPLTAYWQHIDPPLLQERLAESLFYLHSQPPLFNLFLGAVQKVAPAHTVGVLTIVYKLIGLGVTLLMSLLMTRLGVGRWLATMLTLLFVLSPACIHYENIPSYTFPVTALLCAAAVLLHRFAEEGRTRDAVGAFAVMAILVLMRSLFQLVWFLGIVMIIAMAGSPSRRRVVVRCALLPLVLVAALYVKNAVLFGTHTTSSWFGMNWYRVVTFRLPPDQITDWIADGTLSPLANVKTFAGVDAYRPHLPPLPPTGIPLLDDETTSTGLPNYHHAAYLWLGKKFGADALRLVVAHPTRWMRGMLFSTCIFFAPASSVGYGGLWEGLDLRLPALKWTYNRLLYGQLINHAPDPTLRETRELSRFAGHIGWFILIGFPLLLSYAARRLRSELRAGRRGAVAVTLAFMLTTTVYLTTVSIAFEVGENNRFRFLLEPWLLTFLGLWLQDSLLPRLRHRRGS